MAEKRGRFLGSASLKKWAKGISDGSYRTMLDDWKWIFSYSGHFKILIIIYTILGLSSSTLGLVSAVAGKFLVDVIIGHKSDQLWLAALVMIVSAIISLTFSNLNMWISEKLRVEMTNAIRADAFDCIMESGWQSLNRFAGGDILNRFHSDVEAVASNAVSWLPDLIISIYTFIATFAVIWHYSPVMSLIALSSAPFLLLSGRYLLRKQKQYRKKMMEASSGLYAFESESLHNIDTVKSFGIMNIFQIQLREIQEEYKRITMAWNMFRIKTNVFMALISLVVEFLAYGYALFLMWGGRITYGTMTLFLQQRSSLSGAFHGVVGVLPSFVSGSVSAHRVRELMSLPKEGKAEEIPEGFGDGSLRAVFEKVSFSYENSSNPVLIDSDFEALPGQITAFVGPSGEGKTTALRLLLAMIEPDKGECYYAAPDGRKRKADVKTRSLISYVPQGNTLLSGSIARNLQLAKPDATDEEMRAALEAACAWEFVSEMPGGLYSDIYEGGKGLSEGQAQRVSIARAILRGAPVLLMDEATSALDVETERRLLRSILKKSDKQTIIITTHRPTVLSMCDRVYRVVDGKITRLGEEEIETIVRCF